MLLIQSAMLVTFFTHSSVSLGIAAAKDTQAARMSQFVVGPVGLEPTTKGLCLPLRLSPPLSGLWSGLYLPVTGWPSSLYTFPYGAWLGIGWSQTRTEAFSEFDQFYLTPEQTWQQATHRVTPCALTRI